jgi:PhoH-like ATPase
MPRSKRSHRQLFVLDTNVLMHDPSAIFRFGDNDIFVPMVVLEELDAAKKGSSEVARNARHASRLLDSLIGDAGQESIHAGLALPSVGDNADAKTGAKAGRVFFQTQDTNHALPDSLSAGKADNSLLSMAMALQEAHPDTSTVVVSKDINLRIKARVLGILAEDYLDDMVLDDATLLYNGLAELPRAALDHLAAEAPRWQQDGRTYYTLDEANARPWYPNQCLYAADSTNFDVIFRDMGEHGGAFEAVKDFTARGNTVWGIHARNREQNFALNLLMDPELDFVSLLGTAGTGKTLLALAAGLTQTLEDKRFREIVMTRVTVPVGDDIGFLPGTEEEKMAPWMGALMDNLEVLTDSDLGGEWGRAATNDLLHSRIKIRSLNYMRGRTFLNRYVIIDEAQNLTRKQMMTLITRAGPGTKIVCIGNIAQIDTPYLSETTSGLTYIVDGFKSWRHGGHITLLRGERSRLADFANRELA